MQLIKRLAKHKQKKEMEIYVIAIDSIDELKKHPKFKTDMFKLNISKKTDKEFGVNSYPVAVPYKIWQEIMAELPNTQYDPYENNYDDWL